MSTRTWFEECFISYKVITLSFELSNLAYFGNHLDKNLGICSSKDFIFSVMSSLTLDRFSYFSFYQMILTLFFLSTELSAYF
jgi:hypothetical protein